MEFDCRPKGRIELCKHCNTLLFYYGDRLTTTCLCKKERVSK